MSHDVEGEMRFETQRASLARYCLLSAAGLAGVALVLVSTSRYGPGVSPDSLAYLSTARSLISGSGYLTHDQTPLVHWPPLFPSLLALVGLLTVDLPDAARYTNALAFGLIVLLSGLWLLRSTRSVPLAVLGSAAVLFSRPLLKVSVCAWTEPLFALFVILSLLAIRHFLDSGKWLSLALAATLAAMASLTRYIGVTVILTGVLLLRLQRNTTLLRKLRQAGAFGLAAALPIALWLIRNYAVSSTLAGERHPSAQSLVQVLGTTLDTVALWFVPSVVPRTPRALVAILLLAAMAAMLLLRRRRGECQTAHSSQVVPFACFSVVYLAYLTTSTTIIATDAVLDRLLSPIYVPLIFLIVWIADQAFSGWSSKPILRSLVFLALVLWLTYPLVYAGKIVTECMRNGAGDYLKTVWKGSALADYLKRKPPAGQVYTNAPEALYILAGKHAGLSPVRPKGDRSASPGTASPSLLKFKKSLTPGEETYLVWFANDNYRTYLYGVGELGAVCILEPVVETPDGAVYRVRVHGSDREANGEVK